MMVVWPKTIPAGPVAGSLNRLPVDDPEKTRTADAVPPGGAFATTGPRRCLADLLICADAASALGRPAPARCLGGRLIPESPGPVVAGLRPPGSFEARGALHSTRRVFRVVSTFSVPAGSAPCRCQNCRSSVFCRNRRTARHREVAAICYASHSRLVAA